MSAFSSAADELADRMSEAKGMLTSIFGSKKQKKPRELVSAQEHAQGRQVALCCVGKPARF